MINPTPSAMSAAGKIPLVYFRKTFDFTGTPIRFVLRERKKDNQ